MYMYNCQNTLLSAVLLLFLCLPLFTLRYLAKPYLINGSKFDLRIYVYVTSYDPLRIYIFEDGLVRFCNLQVSTKFFQLYGVLICSCQYLCLRTNCAYVCIKV